MRFSVKMKLSAGRYSLEKPFFKAIVMVTSQHYTWNWF